VYSTTKYVESEGQRGVRLAQQFLTLGRTVIYVYWDWSEADRRADHEIAPGLYVISRHDFLRFSDRVVRRLDWLQTDQWQLIIQYPDPAIIPFLVECNSRNVATTYDLLDDWEAFHRVGQAIWYEEQAEHFILCNTLKRFAVSEALVEKHSGYRVRLLPNGFDPKVLALRPAKDLRKGRRTIGYFGHLTDSWFDWDLVLQAASSRDDFVFHIIGYGMPSAVQLPENVIFHGRKHPSDLSSYVATCDVCIVPFKDGPLAQAVDPIKLYEYLFFRKPVVTTGVRPYVDAPYVLSSANRVEEFVASIEAAAAFDVDDASVESYLADKQWLHRAQSMLADSDLGDCR
jgi:hypothetical protein